MPLTIEQPTIEPLEEQHPGEQAVASAEVDATIAELALEIDSVYTGVGEAAFPRRDPKHPGGTDHPRPGRILNR